MRRGAGRRGVDEKWIDGQRLVIRCRSYSHPIQTI